MSKKTLKNKFLQVGLISLFLLSNSLAYIISNPIESYASDVDSLNIPFDYSTSRTQSKTITIPNLRNVKSITTTNGNVSYVQDGEQVTIAVSDGAGQQFQTGGTYIPEASQWVTNQSSNYYNAGGYTGYLSAYLAGGSYTSEASQWVSSQLNSYYNSGGYTGYLSSYLYSGSYTYGDSKYVTQNSGYYTFGYHCSDKILQYKSKYSEQPYTGDKYYNQGGYSGTLTYSETQGTHPNTFLTMCNGVPLPYYQQERYLYNYQWSGTVYKPDSDTRVYRYEGYVYKPASDTRYYRYEGYVTKPAVDTRTWEPRYAYNVTVEYSAMPLAPAINLNRQENVWHNQDVVATIVDNENDALNDFSVEYRLSTDNEWKTYSTPITFSEEGIFTIEGRVVTESGDISPITTKTVKIDKTKPDVQSVVNNTNWTNETLNINLSSSDLLSGVKRIKLHDGNWVNGSTANYSAPTNGLYTFVVEDNAGNTTTKEVNITNIDKTNPDISLSVEPSTWTNQDANIKIVTTDSHTGVKRIQLPDGNWISTAESLYQITTNGTYTFKVEDNVGNMTTKSVVVTNIDKTVPTKPIISLSDNDWAIEKVSFTLANSVDTQSGVKKYQYKVNNGNWVDYAGMTTLTEEGIHTLSARAIDNAGNSSAESNVNVYIDNSSPTIEIKEDVEGWTNKPIRLTATASDLLSGVKEILLPNATLIRSSVATQQITTNGVYTFIVEDNVGNSKTESFEVKNIDVTKPTVRLAINPATWTNQDALIEATAFDTQSGIKRIQLPDSNWVDADSTSYRIAQNGTYTFNVEDVAGNITTEKIIVTNIDKTKPSKPVITLSNNSWVIDEVSITINGSPDGQSGISHYQYQLNDGEWVTYNGVIKEGTDGVSIVNARAVDIAGNISDIATKTIYVDNGAPEISVKSNITEWTNQNVILTATAKDSLSGIKRIQFPNTYWLYGSTGAYTVTANGSYNFVAEDLVGNRIATMVTVSNIDKTLPTLALTNTYTQWTNQPVLIQASASDNESRIKRIQLPDGTWVNNENASHYVSQNGTYLFKTEDNAGNIVSKQISVSNIDITPPTKPTVTYNSQWTANEYVSLTALPGTDTQSGVKGIEYKLEGATESGWTTYNGEIRVSNEGITNVIFHTVDNVGNTSQEVIASVKIDRSSPYNNSIVIHLKGQYQPN